MVGCFVLRGVWDEVGTYLARNKEAVDHSTAM